MSVYPGKMPEAVCAVQKAGVKIAIATGRGRIGVGKGLLRSIRPDYWVARAVPSWWTTRVRIWPCTV